MNDSAWYRALNFWCNIKTPLGSGLTIPFLIGVEKKYGRGDDFGIYALLEEFTSLENDFFVSIRFCDYIGMDVCSLDILDNQEERNYKNFGSLILIVDDYNHIHKIENLKELIKNEYSTYIENNNFSLNQGTWSDFSSNDLVWLNKVI